MKTFDQFIKLREAVDQFGRNIPTSSPQTLTLPIFPDETKEKKFWTNLKVPDDLRLRQKIVDRANELIAKGFGFSKINYPQAPIQTAWGEIQGQINQQQQQQPQDIMGNRGLGSHKEDLRTRGYDV